MSWFGFSGTLNFDLFKKHHMKDQRECLVCRKSQLEMPVTKFYHQDSAFYICARHIPILIHDPQKLVGLLPDADKMEGA
jgi:hypothetical protein